MRAVSRKPKYGWALTLSRNRRRGGGLDIITDDTRPNTDTRDVIPTFADRCHYTMLQRAHTQIRIEPEWPRSLRRASGPLIFGVAGSNPDVGIDIRLL